MRICTLFVKSMGLLAFLMLLAMGIAACGPSSKDATGNSPEQLYEQAYEVSSPEYGIEDKEEGLRLLSLALDKNPNFKKALNYRIGLLIADGRTEEAIKDLEHLHKLTGHPEIGFSLCMAREYVKGSPDSLESCYQSVADKFADIIEGKLHLDLRYLMALKMADEKAFEAAKAKALSEVGPDAALWGPEQYLFEVLEMDRRKYVEEIHGARP